MNVRTAAIWSHPTAGTCIICIKNRSEQCPGTQHLQPRDTRTNGMHISFHFCCLTDHAALRVSINQMLKYKVVRFPCAICGFAERFNWFSFHKVLDWHFNEIADMQIIGWQEPERVLRRMRLQFQQTVSRTALFPRVPFRTCHGAVLAFRYSRSCWLFAFALNRQIFAA